MSLYEPLPDSQDDPELTRNKLGNAKAFKTLGLDSSSKKKQKMLGLTNEQLLDAMKQVSEMEAEHGISPNVQIPEEQLEQYRRRSLERVKNSKRSRSSSPTMRTRPRVVIQKLIKPDSELDESMEENQIENDPNNGVNIQIEGPYSDSLYQETEFLLEDELEEEEEMDTQHASVNNELSNDYSGLDLEVHLQKSIPNQYFYYYWDGKRQQPRRRRASFGGEKTPMMNKRTHKKAFTILGIDPSKEKMMDLLGIEESHQLEDAINQARTPPELTNIDEHPSSEGRNIQPKALTTLGFPLPPSKAHNLLGMVDLSKEESLKAVLDNAFVMSAFV